ncbi:NACHT domain-containing protein [Paenibacillus illinoisensis]|uniref:NACHT domain-containing protein n=1 Tax=Paenibacillus illinoisensis TaxID=59845 RepID=UPI003D985FFE
MNDHFFSWKRFWCPRTSTINLSDGGYLYNPESEYGHIYNEHVVPFDKIAQIPCLILLGEPGIGKTGALKSIKIAGEKHTIKIDLRSYGREDRLVRDIFENSLFEGFLKGEHHLHIFLDSLDECLLRLDYVAVLLAEEFKKYKSHPNLKNLFLRIICRTAEWPSLLERELAELWGKEDIQIMELAPLRKMDVYNAAIELGIDADRFMDELRVKEVIPLAIKPITLKFLFNLFIRYGSFPSTQKELYLQGCELLCEETNESRITSRHTGSMRAKDRLKVASRIAAMMIFSNKYAIWRSINLGNVPEEDITISDISGEHLQQMGRSMMIPETEITETLSTGLFSSRGLNRFGWAHQTYAEFLAALYVTQNEPSLVQIMSLIEHPNEIGSERKLVPQLHEVSSWIATMNSEVFRQIIICDPQVLLRSDIINAEYEAKKSLVYALLEQYNEEKIREWDFDDYFHKLKNPFLVQQIKPYMLNRNYSYAARRAAIRIARVCEVSVLKDDLLKIALNRDEDYQIRIQAGYALSDLASEETRKFLFPLLKLDIGDDADDELKGAALRALWPHHISAKELFSVLTLPKRRNFIGLYRMFLKNNDVFVKLQVEDLPSALEWVLKFAEGHEFDSSIDDLVYGILYKAGQHLNMNDVLIAFTDVIRARLVHFDNFSYIRDFLEDHNKRRALLFSLLNSNIEKKVLISARMTSLTKSEDFSWMIKQIQHVTDQEHKQNWCSLIKRTFNPYNYEHVNLLYSALQNDTVLAQHCQVFFQSVPLDSEQARELKESYAITTKSQDSKDKQIHPPIKERIYLRLNEFEEGNLDAWWHLIWTLGITEENKHGVEFDPNIKTLPNWNLVNVNNEVRIVNAAKRYVLEKDSESSNWFGTDAWNRPAMAGYKALRLIYEEDADFLSSLTSSHWENWSPVILTQVETSETEELTIQTHLVKLAYSKAPQKVISDLVQLIDKENQQHATVFIISKMKDSWDTRLGEVVLNILQTQNLMPKSIKSLLQNLIQHKIGGATDYARSLIKPEFLVNEDSRKLAIVSAVVLLNNVPKIGWDIVWSLKETYTEFVQDVLISYSGEFERYKLFQVLSEVALADLYSWLVKIFPPNEDPNHDDEEMAHWVGPREEVADFRDASLRYLANKGTLEACDEIARIVSELPELPWLKWMLLEAQSTTRRNTWVPPTPIEVIRLVENGHNRLVQSGEQLMEVLVESLTRLEQKLHGITPAVVWLWNEVGKKIYRPRTENEFSDFVKQHLEEDLLGKGIIVNREVEIRSSTGSLPGERTDIHINAILPGRSGETSRVITVIIEVKGNWHRELFQAMETQLVNRYLQEDKCKYGLYLIGWFESLRWDENDRRSAIPSVGLQVTKNLLADQAKSLSRKGRDVRSFVMNLYL